ncbi:MAG TPA: DUF5678 domain-containing protein [Candidatus Paceibacterota bacterium]
MAIDWTKIYKKYKGLWVALAKDEKTVLGAGRTVQEAVRQAKMKSDETPFLTRMPEKIVPFVGAL